MVVELVNIVTGFTRVGNLAMHMPSFLPSFIPSFSHQLQTEHLLCARHHAKAWDYGEFHTHTCPHGALESAVEAGDTQVGKW